MRSRLAFVAVVVVIIAGAYFGLHLRQMDLVPPPRNPGQRVPSFTAPLVDGGEFKFEPSSPARQLVVFWASWCGPCAEETPSLVALAKAKPDWHLIMVSQDSSKAEILAFLKIFSSLRGPNISLLWDLDRSVGRKFGVEGLPESFLVDQNGRLTKKFVGATDWRQLLQ